MGEQFNMYNEFRNFILEKNLEIVIKKNTVTITNYVNVDHFEPEKIIIKCTDKIIIIKGSNLRVKRLLKDEILIIGVIKNIELR